ncbi:MAG: MgtC/SapB family protein [Gammaproteobacteria bacterium]
MTDEQQLFYNLAVALAIGLLIGIERGWRERDAKEGERIAGVRTYGLIGLLGGGAALLGEHFGSLVLAVSFLALAAVLTAVYIANLKVRGDVGITSLVAGLLTFVFGAMAVSGEITLAAAAAVLTTLLLGYKSSLHRWLGALEEEELRAGIKLLLISVVLLPVLPNKGYGPWQALNPYAIWWMVVLIAFISFAGYFLIKIGGARKGIIFTGIFGGLASSTALTLHFSRESRQHKAMAPLLSTGILLACGTMFPRMLLVAGVINPELVGPMLPPAIIMSLIVFLPALYYGMTLQSKPVELGTTVKNPLEMKSALGFGLLLALIMLLVKALQTWFDDAGVLLLAAVSGITDVDAINLSLARMSHDDLTIRVAVVGIVIAAAANSLCKGGMAAVIGNRETGLRVGLPLLASAAAGLLSVRFFAY